MLSSGRAYANLATGDATLHEILAGLARQPKRLPCKLLYDARGSELFERICELDEYYPARTELAILRQHASELARRIGPDCVLVEFGSGASLETRVLLDALERPRLYVPVGISPVALGQAAAALRARYPKLDVRPLAADYMRRLVLPLSLDEQHAPLTFFCPGSTIGNFERTEALQFLHGIRESYGEEQRFLVGVDLPKARPQLEAAYADAQGLTAELNRNALHAINRTYGADFRPECFEHRAPFNEAMQRVEMQLVSSKAQTVNLAGRRIALPEGETIVTQHCYKYPLLDFARLARRAGFDVAQVWTDPEQLFSVQLLETARAPRSTARRW